MDRRDRKRGGKGTRELTVQEWHPASGTKHTNGQRIPTAYQYTGTKAPAQAQAASFYDRCPDAVLQWSALSLFAFKTCAQNHFHSCQVLFAVDHARELQLDLKKIRQTPGTETRPTKKGPPNKHLSNKLYVLHFL